MIKQYIHCLEKVLNPSTNESPYAPLIKSHLIHVNRLDSIQIRETLIKFQKDFKNLKERKIDEILDNLAQIIGYGLGSTPESDDLFMGILAAKFCLNEDIADEFEYLAKFPFERYTTPKSAQLIRSFLIRNFPSEIIPFIELLKKQSENNQPRYLFELEVRKIRKLGASSGYYFLLGVLWELKRYSSI